MKTLRVFQNMEEIDSILIAADSSYMGYCLELAGDNGITKLDADCRREALSGRIRCTMRSVRQGDLIRA